jgi:hypothetical protein
LKESIDIEYFAGGGWGIGNIDILNKVSPHYGFLNYGGTPPSTIQYPNLRGTFEGDILGLFRKGKPYYPIYPKRYKGMDYIEATDTKIRNQIDTLINLNKVRGL